VTICKEAVVTNALKTIRQYVEEEAAYELCDLESDDFALVPTTSPIIVVAEADVGLVEIVQASIRNCDAMSVAGEIG
jgi:hypothetical protein